MASRSGSELIIFIASLIIAASVAGAIVTEVYLTTNSFETSVTRLNERIQSDIKIINDPKNIPYNETGNNNLTIYVKNTGRTFFPKKADLIDVLIDGRYQTDISTNVVNGEEWKPSKVLEIKIHAPDLENGDHRVSVGVNGIKDVLKIRL